MNCKKKDNNKQKTAKDINRIHRKRDINSLSTYDKIPSHEKENIN